MGFMSAAGRMALGAGAIGAGIAGRSWMRQRRTIDLYGRVVLITGGSRGLGLVMARHFAAEGAKLVLCARTESDLERAAEELRQDGAEVLTVRCDVADRTQVRNLIRRANEHFGRIDVLVNNAGVIAAGPLETQTIQDFEMAMDIMYWGVVYPTLEVLPQMKERQSGRIVNITSLGGKISVPHLLSYNSAKFAAVGFSEGLTAEVAKDGIRVTTVVPGVMRTGGHVNAWFKGQHKQEYAIFSITSSMPVTSVPAERVAQRVIEAVKVGDPEITPSFHARFASRVNGLMPGTTTSVLGLVNRVLPGPGGTGARRKRGKESESTVSKSVLGEPGRQAAEENLEYDRSANQDREVGSNPSSAN
jgi:NAD(P)-dependent dehydrogenase (short-subunit alcohol dehydrogenase family)